MRRSLKINGLYKIPDFENEFILFCLQEIVIDGKMILARDNTRDLECNIEDLQEL